MALRSSAETRQHITMRGKSMINKSIVNEASWMLGWGGVACGTPPTTILTACMSLLALSTRSAMTHQATAH